MIDFEMSKSTKHKTIVPFEFVSVNDRVSPYLFHRQLQQRLCPDVRDNFDGNLACSLQNTKDGDLPCSTTPSFSFSTAAKIGLIGFHFPFEQVRVFVLGQDRSADGMKPFKGSGIGNPHFPGCFSGRGLQLEHFDKQEPFPEPDPKRAEVCSGEMTKLVTTAKTKKTFSAYVNYISTMASWADFSVVFPPKLEKKSPGFFFCYNKLLNGYQVHTTSLI